MEPMNITSFVKEGESLILPSDPGLTFSGRIGCNDDGEPEFVFPCTYVKWRFHGTGAAVVVTGRRFYWDMFAGCNVDGRQYAFKLADGETTRLELAHDLPDCDHEITFYKRQDACNNITVHGIILDPGAKMEEAPVLPARKLMVIGDSVSAGEVSEAVAYTARPDPEGHEGYYSNSWYSYSWLAARMLNAELHDIAQGGAALLDGTGWFDPGMESIYDKLKYYPDTAHSVSWDMSRYVPHVIVVAVGQNDNHPEDYMKEDYDSDKSRHWRTRYGEFIAGLRALYPKALIVCTTTILGHDASWDRAIGEAVDGLNDPRISHFMYTGNGAATPGHIRIPEAEVMARELTEHILSFGDDIWL